jgi:hypothetical protein
MFARRNEPDLRGNPGIQDSLREALRERGGQVLMYGDTGVGKSSLLKYAAEDEDLSFVSVECFSDRSFEALMEEALRKLIDVREIKRTSSRGASGEVEASGGITHFLSLKGRFKGDVSKAKEFEVIQKSPLEALLDAMDAAGHRLLVLDNFQNVTADRDRLLVAQSCELLADRANETGDKKLVMIGIADDARSLLGASASVARRVAEVGVPRMPDDEIREILERGFALLNLTADEESLEKLVFYADGFPYFTHLLGLHVARRLSRLATSHVSVEEVEASLDRVAQQVEESFGERVRLAAEKGGEVQPRSRIISLMAASSGREWRGADVQAEYTATYGSARDFAFLHAALGALATESHGAILKRTGSRGAYVYKFRDPHMRPFLRVTHFTPANEDTKGDRLEPRAARPPPRDS